MQFCYVEWCFTATVHLQKVHNISEIGLNLPSNATINHLLWSYFQMEVYYVLNLKTVTVLYSGAAPWQCCNCRQYTMVSEPIGRIEFHSTVQESNDTLLTLGAAMEKHDDIIER